MAKKILEDNASSDSYVSLALGLAVVLLIGATLVNVMTKKSADKTPETNTKSTATESAQISQQTTHTVAPDETLWSISEKYFKSGYNWQDIQKANNLSNPDIIEVGSKLIIPVVTPANTDGQVSSASIDSKPKDTSYTVQNGDSLWSIAVKEYENGYRWSDIAAINNLTDPGIIHVGNVLKMP